MLKKKTAQLQGLEEQIRNAGDQLAKDTFALKEQKRQLALYADDVQKEIRQYRQLAADRKALESELAKLKQKVADAKNEISKQEGKKIEDERIEAEKQAAAKKKESDSATTESRNAKEYVDRAYKSLRGGQYQEAVKDFKKAISLDPKNIGAYNSLAWLHATCQVKDLRDGTKSVEYAKKACELTGYKSWAMLDTLAAACAEAGKFEDAVQWQRKAILSSDFSEDSFDDSVYIGVGFRMLLFTHKVSYTSEGSSRRALMGQVPRKIFTANPLAAFDPGWLHIDRYHSFKKEQRIDLATAIPVNSA